MEEGRGIEINSERGGKGTEEGREWRGGEREGVG